MTCAKFAAFVAVFGAVLFLQGSLGYPGRLASRTVFVKLMTLETRQWEPRNYPMMAAGVTLVVIGVVWRRWETKG